jgi:5-methylcytosine-specific restriction endonuclease McrA
MSPVTPCLEPTCGAWATYRGRCDRHAPEREKETHPRGVARGRAHARAGYASRIYSSKRWLLTRRRKLARTPICEACDEVLATEVDHVVPIEDGGEPWAEANLSSLCSPCHGRKTMKEVRAREYA